jgi:subtilase family serine protease
VFRVRLCQWGRRLASPVFVSALALGLGPAGAVVAGGSLPQPMPTVSEYQYLSASATPPAEPACFSVGRRCFTPASIQASYNLAPLYAAGNKGRGMTIAIIDSFGNPNIASDLANFDAQMGLPNLCGETGTACTPGTPTFQHVYWNGTTR